MVDRTTNDGALTAHKRSFVAGLGCWQAYPSTVVVFATLCILKSVTVQTFLLRCRPTTTGRPCTTQLICIAGRPLSAAGYRRAAACG
jgi:hypothetical protein